ncbi:hypothetical protein EAO27_02695 [Sphingopyxis sp. YF1]|uniref:hypothetical protein n=1 Tax=Sphingopyxis sp. YF1 TaxID=2482763 RepID=UPI001F620DF3|nr:hypothetical protein [Sphingopyxis sp. YF1]UNU41742.1 hypothetical protein EAO27_02695 [Sphingopyxis sp. YF1]
MTVRGDWDDALGFETARPGTLYWTLSLYIEPDRVAAAAGQAGKPLRHDQFGAMQANHLPSLLLRNAIDPLFNDIADREVLGEVQEHLLAAADALPLPADADRHARHAHRKATEKTIRAHERLRFKPPASAQWSTEGVTYRAEPAGLNDERAVRFRRFWLAHNNGALSYHMGFSHHYASLHAEGDQAGYDPATYYFLSLLQKLAAPKEFELGDRWKPGSSASVFEENLGIAPLDELTVTDAGGTTERFWPFVRRRMLDDAGRLFDRLAAETGRPRADDLAPHLIDEVPFIEVPGLRVPKSRFMFLLHDERFFKRLMPLDPVTGESAARKVMVQELCYLPFQEKLEERVSAAEAGDGIVRLDTGYWNWATTQPQYEAWIKGRKPVLRKAGGGNFRNVGELAAAMRQGAVELTVDEAGAPLPAPLPMKIPAFEPQRTDCLDYLFLAGFNQNIIDFMNQDTSEILDSIDPIYPDSDEQSDERFFVRYANHRAMVTYVPKSRSLETGNDYIGTCPYAFLIHALALHNEYLAREHEAKSMARIERIEWLVAKGQGGATEGLSAAAKALDRTEKLDGADEFDRAEMAINQVKFAEYKEYERFRYANPFRYDTERVVFGKLEGLRGTTRKKEALALAIASLEDHASDLQRRHQAEVDKQAARRDRQLSILLGGTGVFGAGQMIYWIGETAAGDPDAKPAKPAEPVVLDFLGMPDTKLEGQTIMDTTEALMFYALIVFVPLFFYVFGSWVWASMRTTRMGRRIEARLRSLRRRVRRQD